MADVLRIVELVWSILGPLASRMIDAAMKGDDPRSVLLSEHVLDILPAQSATERAMLAARKNGGAQ